jgi:hypothetical protein
MRGQQPAAALYCEAGEGLEVEGKRDVRGRPGSERGEGEGKVGRGGVGGLEEKVGRAGKRKEGGREVGRALLLGRRGCWAAG